jgi:hypothetical protein
MQIYWYTKLNPTTASSVVSSPRRSFQGQYIAAMKHSLTKLGPQLSSFQLLGPSEAAILLVISTNDNQRLWIRTIYPQKKNHNFVTAEEKFHFPNTF